MSSNFSTTTPLSAQPVNTATTTNNPATADITTTTTGSKSLLSSLKKRWSERKGVPEPKDANGRGIYSGRTTEEHIQTARQQKVDGRMYAGFGTSTGSA